MPTLHGGTTQAVRCKEVKNRTLLPGAPWANFLMSSRLHAIHLAIFPWNVLYVPSGIDSSQDSFALLAMPPLNVETIGLGQL